MKRISTYSYRIKDSSCAKHLCLAAGSVNYVWNFCNATSIRAIKERGQFLSAYDLDSLTSGASKELPLVHSDTIQEISKQYVQSRRQHKKARLRFRSARKKDLGWIPFKARSVKLVADTITYRGRTYRFWFSRPLPDNAKLVTGSFNQDAQGHWFLNLQFKFEVDSPQPTGDRRIGIDLGLKTQITCSDGQKIERENLGRKTEGALAVAQRARKKKRVRKIHANIRNQRKDWNHKKTTLLIRSSSLIRVGNVSSSRLVKTNMAKGVSDASWFQVKTMLKYKAVTHGVDFAETNESYSTVTCSHCLERTGPRGLEGLGVRDWECRNCGTSHDRDVNAAKNILIFGLVGRPDAGRFPLSSSFSAGTGGSKERQLSLFPLGH